MDSTQGEPAASPPPVWENVPFDVGCARCAHDLRGLTEPTCPACGLTFDWAKAVPIEQLTCLECGYHLYGLSETRCPECGAGFTWREVLDGYHRGRNPLFEYQWCRRPVRSLIGTWARALRPARFWRSVNIHEPPCVGALIAFTLVSALITASSTALVAGLVHAMFGDYGLLFLVMPAYWLRILLSAFSSPLLFWMFVWSAVSGVAMVLPQQTLQRFRVHWRHLLRVWVYNVVVPLPLYSTAILVISAFSSRASWQRLPSGAAPVIVLLVGLACSLLVVRSLHQSFRHYLRLPNALGLAVASQVLALLAVLIALFNSTVFLSVWVR